MKGVIVVLTLVNFLLLVPGVTLPIYSVHISTEVQASIIPDPVEVTVYEQTRSILGTVAELWASADYLVSFLILLFSVIVPVTKGGMLLASIFVTVEAVKEWLVRVVDVIGKWSMADVFVVAIFLAYLATRDQGQSNQFSVEAPLPLLPDIEVAMETHLTSILEPGFYYFLGYCLFSVFWAQVLRYRLRAA